ncbi:MAG TPA: hypothetical protein VFA70_06615 [Dehalococcoidia bacterium]|jgi:hypothetical protein|nr:hypothetical protein [Dehalococcoidia bacterium]
MGALSEQFPLRLDSCDRTRDGEEVTAHARWSMLRDMELLRRLAQRFAEGGAD